MVVVMVKGVMPMTSTDKMRTRPVVRVVGFVVQVMRRVAMRAGQIAGAGRMRLRGGGASDNGVGGDGPATQARSLDGG